MPQQINAKNCRLPPCAKLQCWSIIEVVPSEMVGSEIVGGRKVVASRQSRCKSGDSVVFGMFNNHAQDNQAQYSLHDVAHRFVGVHGHGYIEI